MMPGMDGFQVLEQMRREPKIDWPVVLMLSSCGQREVMTRCLTLGAAAYLVKPVSPSELLLAMENPAAEDSREHKRTCCADTRHRFPVKSEPILGIAEVWRILVAEDNPVNQLLAVRVLQEGGTYHGRGRQRPGSFWKRCSASLSTWC